MDPYGARHTNCSSAQLHVSHELPLGIGFVWGLPAILDKRIHINQRLRRQSSLIRIIFIVLFVLNSNFSRDLNHASNGSFGNLILRVIGGVRWSSRSSRK